MSILSSLKSFVKKPFNVLNQIYLKSRINSLKNTVKEKALLKDDQYESYLEKQIKKSYVKNTSVVVGDEGVNKRTTNLVALFKDSARPKTNEKILCVGCRNVNELNYIESHCKLSATGLDLFSEDPRIIVGDMHKMPFENNAFDHLYSCHSLEHAFDLDIALKEFVRVVKPGGSITIEVPVNFKPNETDYWDVNSGERLKERVLGSIDKVLFQENGKNAGNSNKDVVRFIFSVKK